MTTNPQTWTGKAAIALTRLGARPWTLFLFIWTLNGLARPYAGFIHDARLYAVQVLNQMERGAFADDLFLRYGSQDQFSLFSRLVAPLANCIGLELTFFALYLVFNGLFLFALVRLVRALVPDRRLSTLALIYLAVAPLPFGGLSVFNVQETFLTPRILANALTLLALERTLRGRYFAAMPLLAGAMSMHPLMAFGGVLIWLGCLAVVKLSKKTLALLLVAIAMAGVAILAVPGVGMTLFGPMDADWRDMIRRSSAYNFPVEWAFHDWLHVVVSLAVLVGVSITWRPANPRRARFLKVVAAAGLAGVLGTVLGSCLPYALLFQGQPYRILWIVRVLEIPLAFWLIARWLSEGRRPVLAIGLAAYLGLSALLTMEVWFPLCFWPIVAVAYRGMDPQPRRANWLAISGVVSLLWGCVSWSAYKWFLIWDHRETILAHVDGLNIGRLVGDNAGPVGWMIAATYALVRCQPWRPSWIAAPACALLVNVIYFALPLNPYYREHCTRDCGDIDFVRDFLKERGPKQPAPTIYCSLGRADYLWVDLRAKSYYDWAQVVGVLFSRQTAQEGGRRAVLVGRFEMDRLRDDPLFPEDMREIVERLYQTPWDAPAPTWEEFQRLCREDLDYAVLKHDFPGQAAATNGRVFIYDCRAIQAALISPQREQGHEGVPLLALRAGLNPNFPSPTKETSP